jgi:hypothetical protein
MSSKGGKKEEVKAAPAKVAPTKVAESSEGGNIMDDLSKKQAYKKFSYRGEDITKLLGLNIDDLA